MRRLTADCIWNSFQSSGKRHLILTGSKKSGKTTLLSEISGTIQPSGALPGKVVYTDYKTILAEAPESVSPKP